MGSGDTDGGATGERQQLQRGTADGASWIDAEVARCALGDNRLCDRLRLPQHLKGAVGAPLPLACQDWADAKATGGRFVSTAGLVPVVQDTTGSACAGPSRRPLARSAECRSVGTAKAIRGPTRCLHGRMRCYRPR
ncbi:IS4/Tn5 family transposase DNA-binding protein [Siccirubricoccus deserti]|uniref:Transposase Tn5-like N-terminal domain-containing protein n=1 Tax=Siccirubricoccus deserti TaxID=2013562 RepID=A0A9X0QYF6_9PROT|nr:hypothetical protein [Siccirubricoccus deserti]